MVPVLFCSCWGEGRDAHLFSDWEVGAPLMVIISHLSAARSHGSTPLRYVQQMVIMVLPGEHFHRCLVTVSIC